MKSTEEVNKLNAQFITAALDGDTQQLANLLEQGADINAQDPISGCTALIIAVTAANTDLNFAKANLLLEQGLDINYSPSRWTPLLERAVQLQRIRLVTFLIDKKADVNKKGFIVTTALMHAILTGNIPIIHLLINNGANANIKDPYGNSSFHFASTSGNDAIKNIFIEHQKNLNNKLEAAVISGDDLQTKTLLTHGADINAQDEFGFTFLMRASMTANADAVNILIKNNAFLNSKNKNGQTALMCAVGLAHYDIVVILLNAGADINIKDNNGKKAIDHTSYPEMIQLLQSHLITLNKSLIHAGLNGNTEESEKLLNQGADIDFQDENGWTPLMWAACRGQVAMVTYLIAQKAKIDVKNHDAGRTALAEVVSRYRGNAKIVIILLNAGANANIKDNTNHTAFSLAKISNSEVMKMLLKEHQEKLNRIFFDTSSVAKINNALTHGADAKCRGSDSNSTPLMQAITFKSSDAATILIPHSDINAQDDIGDTPLICALHYSMDEIAHELLKAGADVTLKCTRGYAASMYARGITARVIRKAHVDQFFNTAKKTPANEFKSLVKNHNDCGIPGEDLIITVKSVLEYLEKLVDSKLDINDKIQTLKESIQKDNNGRPTHALSAYLHDRTLFEKIYTWNNSQTASESPVVKMIKDKISELESPLTSEYQFISKKYSIN